MALTMSLMGHQPTSRSGPGRAASPISASTGLGSLVMYRDDNPFPSHRRRSSVAEVAAVPGLVVETVDGRFCGAVVATGRAVDAGERRDTVTLEDRHGRRRVFPMLAASFAVDGVTVTLVPDTTVPASAVPPRPVRTASGSFAVASTPAKVARASRIWVEGTHDAALVERIWGDDLRVEAVVVEPMNGIDELPELIRGFAPSPQRRVGVLVDHLVPGSKESLIAARIRNRDVLITGHPYVDVWQAVKPTALGIDAWPTVPRGQSWKDGICSALGVSDPGEMWRRVLAGVDSYADVEQPLLRAVEELIDFVTE
jgi:hypothetical protein